MAMVYDTWDARLQSRMDELIVANNTRCGNFENCLRLRGLCHWHSSMQLVASQDVYPKNKLHPSLKDQAHAWLEDYNEIEQEKRIVSHSLSSVLSISARVEDYEEMLPEGLHPILHNLTHMLPDQALEQRAPMKRVADMKTVQAPFLALMGQRFVLSLIL